MIKIELQYFQGCPNSDLMMQRLQEAISLSGLDADYREILVETPAKAEEVKFRGSPTVLVNGMDLERLPEPEKGNLACRYYREGIPSAETLVTRIRQLGGLE